MSAKKLTTSAGAPVTDNQNSLTAGPRGASSGAGLSAYGKRLAHQNRERIPERVVHAKGWGAHGIFTVTPRHYEVHKGAAGILRGGERRPK